MSTENSGTTTENNAMGSIKKSRVDGQTLKRLTEAGFIWLKTNQKIVNALNVFPVPDGDTGTNMVLTMQAAWDEIKNSPDREIGKIAHDIAHGALMGARGNSGVILSQIWRGFARALDNQNMMDAARKNARSLSICPSAFEWSIISCQAQSISSLTSHLPFCEPPQGPLSSFLEHRLTGQIPE